jgi:cobalamin biosynthesis protein CbiM
MHVPDGFMSTPVCIGAGAVAVAGVAVCLGRARQELDDRAGPLTGLTAAFIFAAQMLNFPVAAGTSGHLVGGTLAAILVGPAAGVLCLSIVLLLQTLLFADGGLTALGVNVLVLGLINVLVGYGVFRALARVLPGGRTMVTAAVFVASAVSIPVSAMAVVGLYALGGNADVPLGTMAAAMGGVHVLIGLGEAAITSVVVGSLLAVRPDLVYGARALVTAPRYQAAPPQPAPGSPVGLERSGR